MQRLIIWLWWKVKVSAKFRKEYATREPICASKETETIIFYVLFHSRYRAVSIADRLEPNTFESPNKTRDLKVFLARNVDIIANPRNQKPNSKVISSPIFPIVRRWDFPLQTRVFGLRLHWVKNDTKWAGVGRYCYQWLVTLFVFIFKTVYNNRIQRRNGQSLLWGHASRWAQQTVLHTVDLLGHVSSNKTAETANRKSDIHNVVHNKCMLYSWIVAVFLGFLEEKESDRKRSISHQRHKQDFLRNSVEIASDLLRLVGLDVNI